MFEKEQSSDEELQEAFAAGLLKPGLNVATIKKTFKNNVNGLKAKENELNLNLAWVERLDINCQPAPMAPEMYHEVTEKEKNSVVKLRNRLNTTPKNSSQSNLALDDFKREMSFHRQAQAALIEGVARLTALGIPTHRPDDYFAEMAKSDQHMHKVRESLAAKQAGVKKSEKISELRRQRKLSKQTQIDNKLKQAKEKKKMLNEVQKFRKGIRKDLNFLDGEKHKGSSKRSEERKKYKDKKFGFGGKKRGSKRNTKDSASGFDGPAANKKREKPTMRGKGGKGGNKRLGKSRRTKAKGRK